MDNLVLHFQVFLVVWARMTAIVLMAPVLSTPFILDRMKVMLSFSLTLLIFPWVSSFVPALPQDLMMYGLIILKEVMVGVVI
ncbi:MAG: flagellar biosynthetic protein FliR, partial [Spirochaetia bacterium]|nr:flagellar biosynthetic protein FliR [Spirochaetia bacterium]